MTAAITSIFNFVGYWFIGKMAFGIAYLIAWIGGVAIAVEAWLVGVMLGINTGVFQSDIVQKGFSATLAIANLGFVIGIIVIAIATILRSETYGYKKVLWKLVVAGILINFSLVIAAPIFNLGNSFTTYFLNCVDPSGGGCNTQGNGLSSMNNFSANLAGAFNPQVGLITSASTTTAIPSSVALGQSFGQMLIPIFSIGFVAFELVAIAIVLAALIFMLLIRYIYIAILAILMPFAWLGWVFPNIKDWWSKWWHQFIRWTFFSPIVVFFLWLAMSTMNSMRNGTAVANQQFGTYTSTSNPVWGAVSNFLTNAFSPIVAQSMNVILMIGLTIGGLIVADRMSITGAKAAVGAAQSVGKGVGTFVGKQTKKGARATYQKAGGQKLTTRLQQGNLGVLNRVPGARRVASLAGRGIAGVSTNEAMVEDAKKKVPKNPEEIKNRLKGSMNTEDQLAHVAKLVEMGEYKGDEIINGNGTIGRNGKMNGQKASDFMDANQESGIIARYGQGKLTKDADKAVLSNKAMRDAEKELNALAKANKDTTAAMEKLRKATGEFLEKLGKGDISKQTNVNGVLGQNTALSRAITRGFITANPELIPSAMQRMNKITLRNFTGEYEFEHGKEKLRVSNDNTLTDAQKTATLDELDEKLKKFKEALGNNALGLATPETSTAAPATPPPPPKP